MGARRRRHLRRGAGRHQTARRSQAQAAGEPAAQWPAHQDSLSDTSLQRQAKAQANSLAAFTRQEQHQLCSFGWRSLEMLTSCMWTKLRMHLVMRKVVEESRPVLISSCKQQHSRESLCGPLLTPARPCHVRHLSTSLHPGTLSSIRQRSRCDRNRDPSASHALPGVGRPGGAP